MQATRGDEAFETLSRTLSDDLVRASYEAAALSCRPSFLPHVLGRALVWCGNVVYGREPSYLKFRAVEVIARVPYHSWESAAHTLMTLFYTDERRAMRLVDVARFSRLSQDNETMHVVVISQLLKHSGTRSGMRVSVVPVIFAFFYFWASYWLYLLNPRWSFELNYLFEEHAYAQYSRFLVRFEKELKSRPVTSEFLTWYGRDPRTEYDFFVSVRNDELIHRNQSLSRIEELRVFRAGQ